MKAMPTIPSPTTTTRFLCVVLGISFWSSSCFTFPGNLFASTSFHSLLLIPSTKYETSLDPYCYGKSSVEAQDAAPLDLTIARERDWKISNLRNKVSDEKKAK